MSLIQKLLSFFFVHRDWRIMRKRILHPTIYLKDRKHEIDIHVYHACRRLWDAGVETYFSCQGGPEIHHKTGRILQRRAMVVVRRKNANKVCKILSDLNPKINDNLLWKRIAIKFDATEAAKNIPLIIEETTITYRYPSSKGE